MILSFDFGGTKLALGLVETTSGSVLNRAACPTPSNARQSLEWMISNAQILLSASPAGSVAAIGVSFGGLVRDDLRTIEASHHVPGWESFQLAEVLESSLKLPARIANDADAAALGEYHFGAGRGVRNLLYVTASTGIGGGVIVNGMLHRGERALAGEIGHMILQPDGPLCPCGRRGCLEALASGRSIARRMAERLANQGLSSEPITAKQVAEAAALGDPTANQVWAEAMRWLGIGIASAANLLNPGRVVVGGGLSRAGELLLKPVQAQFRQHALDQQTGIMLAALGDEANLLGAAALHQLPLTG